ncbi:hypothetical protein O0I10_013169 [Lichtheimia ornata]|uniref:Uncharacterized protein n=1 Tax=Lichtheimia ornata TaxID=688661 RepID=A0AAD7XP17_9FUNG|nr:uncharacterized protein O0I10_013169 [Lichtheimia ornata]KAJ8651334.1 hypothetical protein O0I10_013169 [Lichtheimia ornata]
MDAAGIAKYRSMDSGQRATSTASFSVSLPYYIFRWFSLLFHLLDTSFHSICSGKATSSISFGVAEFYLVLLWSWLLTTLSMDILLNMPVIGGSYQLQARSSNEQQSPRLYYDSFATVWSALSWPYQLHLRITALAVGS